MLPDRIIQKKLKDKLLRHEFGGHEVKKLS